MPWPEIPLDFEGWAQKKWTDTKRVWGLLDNGRDMSIVC